MMTIGNVSMTKTWFHIGTSEKSARNTADMNDTKNTKTNNVLRNAAFRKRPLRKLVKAEALINLVIVVFTYLIGFINEDWLIILVAALLTFIWTARYENVSGPNAANNRQAEAG